MASTRPPAWLPRKLRSVVRRLYVALYVSAPRDLDSFANFETSQLAPPPLGPFRGLLEWILREDLEGCRLWMRSEPSPGTRECWACHFDASGEIRADYLRYLRDFSAAGYRIRLVSTAPFLSAAAQAAAREICEEVLVRGNFGVDFGSWKALFRRHEGRVTGFGELVLVNDSVFYSGGLGEMLARMTDPTAAWGVSLSYQREPHLQSYFVRLGQPVLCQADPTLFFRAIETYAHKKFVIMNYEIGLSRYLRSRGISLRPAYETPSDPELNPSLQAADLLRAAGCPLYKRALTV